MNIIAVNISKIFLFIFLNLIPIFYLANCSLKCSDTNTCLTPEQICDKTCDCPGTCWDEENCTKRMRRNIF